MYRTPKNVVGVNPTGDDEFVRSVGDKSAYNP